MPQRAFTADEKQRFAKVVASWIVLKDGKAERILKLDLHKQRHEEIVTPAVMTRHEVLMMAIFDELPRKPPTGQSLVAGFKKALAFVRSEAAASSDACGKDHSWSKNEGEKLHMCWRYMWNAMRRSSGSRCYAIGRLKACFVGKRGPLTDAEAGELECSSDAWSDVLELDASDPEPSAASAGAVILDDSPSPQRPPIAAPPSQPVQRKLTAHISIASDAAASPPRPPSAAPSAVVQSSGTPRRALRQKTSWPPSPGAAQVVPHSKFVLPPPSFVEMTPAERTLASHRIRVMTPVGMRSTDMQGRPRKAMKAMKGRAMKGKRSKKPATAMKGTAMKGKPMKSRRSAASSDEAGAPRVIVPRDSGSRETMDVLADEAGAPRLDQVPMEFDSKPMDFADDADSRQWAMETLKMKGFGSLKPSQQANHAAARVRKQEVKTRPGQALIQILREGKIMGQITVSQYGREDIMFAGNLLLFLTGAGYSKEDFCRVKKTLVPSSAD